MAVLRIDRRLRSILVVAMCTLVCVVRGDTWRRAAAAPPLARERRGRGVNIFRWGYHGHKIS